MDSQDVKQQVKDIYGKAARHAAQGQRTACGEAPVRAEEYITSRLYDGDQIAGIPPEAITASLGCGNPTALAQLNPGETVLDLGSGGGIDVLLAAKLVGPTGHVYGLDMTDDMLDLARANQRKAGIDHITFLKGDMEAIPLPDNAVDIIISNCVINLSADKARVLAEAFRVLRPGGRFAISDIVVRGDIPAQVQHQMERWIGCIAGALAEHDYRTTLAQVGFVDIGLEFTRLYQFEDARAYLSDNGIDVAAVAAAVDGTFGSAFVRARKPSEG